MPETIEKIGDVPKWHWYNVRNDLIEQGGLEEDSITINPLTVTDEGCGGTHEDAKFYITWMHEVGLIVTSEKEDVQLVDAFSNVVGYKPFAKYIDDNGTTFEWYKKDPDAMYQTLMKENKVGLTRL